MKEHSKNKLHYGLSLNGNKTRLCDIADFLNSGLDKLHTLISDRKCFYLAYIDIDYDKQYTIQLEMILNDIISHVCTSANLLQFTVWHLSRDDFIILCYSRSIVDVCYSLLEAWCEYVYSKSQIIIGDEEIPGGIGMSIAILRHEPGRFRNFDDYEKKLYALLRSAKKRKGCKYLLQEGDELILKTVSTK